MHPNRCTCLEVSQQEKYHSGIGRVSVVQLFDCYTHIAIYIHFFTLSLRHYSYTVKIVQQK